MLTSDNRFCRPTPTRSGGGATTSLVNASAGRREELICGIPVDHNSSAEAFWWLTAAMNWKWAQTHRYELLAYCTDEPCVHPDSGEVRSAQWCKLLAIADVIAHGRYDSILYLDTDAYWIDPKLSVDDGLVLKFAPGLRLGLTGQPKQFAVSAYFGCNSPWNSCGVTWNSSAMFAKRGSANSGVVLMRSNPHMHQILREWWHARNGWARPNHLRRPGSCSDQAVLWRLWSQRPDLSVRMRVMGNSLSKCMTVIGPRRRQRLFGSPIEHIVSLSPRYRQRGLSEAWTVGGAHHDPLWCVTRVRLSAAISARRLFGHVNSSHRGGPRGRWFDNHPVESLAWNEQHVAEPMVARQI